MSVLRDIVRAKIFASGGGGGGNAVLSGTFIATQNTASHIIEELIGSTVTHFLITAMPSPSATIQSSARAFSAGFINMEDTMSFSIGTSSSGTSVAAIRIKDTEDESFSLDKTTGVFKVATGTAGLGYILAGITYKWFAW